MHNDNLHNRVDIAPAATAAAACGGGGDEGGGRKGIQDVDAETVAVGASALISAEHVACCGVVWCNGMRVNGVG